MNERSTHGRRNVRRPNYSENSAGVHRADRPAKKREGRLPIAVPETYALLQPARELMICLGWLRLFRTIVSPSPAGRHSHE